MNKALVAILAALLALCSATAAAAQGGPTFGESAGERYYVASQLGLERAAALAKQLDACFELYNEMFRFDPSLLRTKLNVREFGDKTEFDAYLGQVVGQTKDDFVYLHYPTPERSELVIYAKPEPDFSASLAHQAFVQFLKAFVPNPPLWIREGLAVWFESAVWKAETEILELPENLAWLETAKSLKSRGLLMSLDKLLEITQDGARSELDVFYPQSWAFASFLINSESKRYNRLLWDSISALKPGASLELNQAAVAQIVKTWYGSQADEDLGAYLESRKTFSELVSEGVQLYADKAWDEATEAFNKAEMLNPTSYIPHYYLGLIAYAKNDFNAAEPLYLKAIDLGCDPAIANYALGVNAYALNRLDEARTFLALAKDAAPDRYGTKVDELLAKFPKK